MTKNNSQGANNSSPCKGNGNCTNNSECVDNGTCHGNSNCRKNGTSDNRPVEVGTGNDNDPIKANPC